jgi:aryl-alcohol dehydrogenase-like predicted oxidoreductase
MQYTKLGGTGLTVSRLCLGTMTFGLQSDEETSRAVLNTAAAAGVTFLDAADVYPLGRGIEHAGRTEEIVGRFAR